MKTTGATSKAFLFFLSGLILCQSCQVYHNVPVTLDQAVKEGTRARIETTNEQKYVYKSIVEDNNEYFGVKNVKGKTTKMLIDQTNLQSIRLKNNSLSTLLSVGLFLATIGAFVLIEFAANFNMFGSSGY